MVQPGCSGSGCLSFSDSRSCGKTEKAEEATHDHMTCSTLGSWPPSQKTFLSSCELTSEANTNSPPGDLAPNRSVGLLTQYSAEKKESKISLRYRNSETRITENPDIQHLVSPLRGTTTWRVEMLVRTFSDSLMSLPRQAD